MFQVEILMNTTVEYANYHQSQIGHMKAVTVTLPERRMKMILHQGIHVINKKTVLYAWLPKKAIKSTINIHTCCH